MGSSRLPGKVLLTLCGVTVLGHVLRRLRACASLSRVVVATTRDEADDPVAEEARREGALVTRGSEHDVLGRFVQAFDEHGGEVGVRITSDCPCLDPRLVEEGVRRLLDGRPSADYLSNTLRRTYPRGYDFEVFQAAALRTAAREARAASEREHVTPFLYRHPERFSVASMERPDPLGSAEWRLTLDTPEDRDVIRALFDRLAPGDPLFGLEEVERLVTREPALLAPNRHVRQTPH
jgi:spore coat polysaccharide biosynthesis protein SpsF